MRQHAYLLWLLLRRELADRFAGSWVGFSWGLLHPLALFGAYTLFFGVIFRVRPMGAYASVGLGAWISAGLLPWIFVAEVLARSPMQVFSHARLVTKHRFPHWILAAVLSLSGAANHGLWILCLALIAPWLGLSVQASWLALLLWLPLLWLFCHGIVLTFSALGVSFRDLNLLAPVLATLWSFATPLAYPPEMVPGAWLGFFRMNPLFPLVEGYRQILLGAPGFPWALWTSFAAWAAFSAVFGTLLFNRLSPSFADEL